MTDDLGRLRTEASSREYPSMARLARALYEAGLSPEQVLRECYGVDFPRETFVLAEASPYTLALLATWTNQPWQLATPLDRGGPAARADTYEPVERNLRALDPDLLPLLALVRPGIDVEDDGLVLCYRLTELAAGRATVFGVREDTEPTRRGDSLLVVLHQHHVDYLRELREEAEPTEDKGEYDLVAPEELVEMQGLVDQIVAFQDLARRPPIG